MKLQTDVIIPAYKDYIDYNSSISMLGSCFSVSIAKKLSERKFSVSCNPFGAIYNPHSVINTLKRLEEGKRIDADELFFKNGVWGDFNFNTTFSNVDRDKALNAMNRSIDKGHKELVKSNLLIITLGTSFCYFKKSDSLPVNNCHKLPLDVFTRRIITCDETVKMFSELLSSEFYRSKNIIFTVSPIRHIKDGLIKNTISKSNLLIAVDSLCKEFENVEYFPSYEIFNDELRDYRYYDTDLIHPSETGVQYVWDKFSNAIISSPAKNIMKEIENIMRDFNHRPLNPNCESFSIFREKLITKATALERNFKSIDFSQEKEIISNFGSFKDSTHNITK